MLDRSTILIERKSIINVSPVCSRESVKSGHHCCPCQAPPPPVLVTTSPSARIIRQSSQPEASACCCSGCCCPLHTATAPSAASLRQLREPGDGIAGIAADSLRINGGIRQFRQVSRRGTPTPPVPFYELEPIERKKRKKKEKFSFFQSVWHIIILHVHRVIASHGVSQLHYYRSIHLDCTPSLPLCTRLSCFETGREGNPDA